MKKPQHVYGALAAGVLLAASTQAAEVSVNGFGSVGLSKAWFDNGDTYTTIMTNPITGMPMMMEHPKEYTIDYPANAKATSELSYQATTKMALQFTADMGEGLKAVAQITGKGGSDFNANLEWGYVSYDLTDQLTVMGGRFRTPFYFYSDFLDVGYAYHWTHVPQSAYNTPFASLNGLQATYTTQIGDSDLRFQAFTGNSDFRAIPDLGISMAQLTDIVGLSAHLTAGNFQIRVLGVNQGLDIHQLDVPGAYSGRATNRDDDVTYYTVAAFYDNDALLIGGEYVHGNTLESSVPMYVNTLGTNVAAAANDSGYLTLGYRFGSVMPHLTYSFFKEAEDFGPGFYGESKTVAVGLRWDFVPSAALKLQYERTETPEAAAYGLQSFIAPGEQASLATATIDFIF